MIDAAAQTAIKDSLHPGLAAGYFVGGLAVTWILGRALCTRFAAHPTPRPEPNLAPVAIVAVVALFGLQLLLAGAASVLRRSFGDAVASNMLVAMSGACAVNLLAAWIAMGFASRRIGVAARSFGLLVPKPVDLAFGALLLVVSIPAFWGAGALNDAIVRALDLPVHQRIVEALLRGDLVLGPVTVLMIVAVVPFCEELFFRGVCFTLAAQVRAPWIAVLASAVIFALLHDPQSFLVILIVGLVLGVVRLRTGSVLASTFVHGSFNALMLANIAHEVGAKAS